MLPQLKALLLALSLWSTIPASPAPISRDDPESTDPGHKGISTARGSAVVVTAWAVTRASMALPPFFNVASAAVLARGLAVTTTADPRAVEMPLWPGSVDSGSSRLIGAAAVGRGLHRLSASSNALS